MMASCLNAVPKTELDCVKGQDINNRGNGYFIDVNVAKNNIEGGIAVSKFDGFWIEDNFAVHSARNSVFNARSRHQPVSDLCDHWPRLYQ